MSPLEAASAIAAISLLTFATRIGGILVMARIPFSPWVEAFLRYHSGSVLVAIVVPPLLQTGPATWLATTVTLTAMLESRNALLALVLGMATAAAYRAAAG